MDDLGINFVDAVPWFEHEQDHPYVLIRVTPANLALLAARLGEPLRRCYISDAELEAAVLRTKLTRAEIVASRLPDAGATMSGDFGEVLGYFYQSTQALPAEAIGPKKWRLKQDRTKPAPKSDVLHFIMPNHPDPSEADEILCSEVKAKATRNKTTPIASAIEDCKKDRTSRLASTLVWLRDRAMTMDLGDVDIRMLNRFINAVDHVPMAKRYRAVAVVCNSLVEKELLTAPAAADSEFTLVVIAVPDLKATYTAAFAAAHASA